MRKIAPTLLYVILIAFVIGTIFYGWGMGYESKNKEDRLVGKIGKEKVSIETFYKQVEIERENLRTRSEREVNAQQIRMVPYQVWETEVGRVLHKNIFKEMALKGSSEEVFDHLKKNPPPGITQHPRFLTDSVFDTAKYVQFLNDPASFEDPGLVQLELYTSEMIIPLGNLRGLLEAGTVPSKAEVEAEYHAENDRAVFEYVKTLPTSFTADSSEITESMIQNYYTAHPDTFTEEEQAELYFVNVPKTATAEDEQVYLLELGEIIKRIADGESTFEEEAKIESDDEGSAKNGGELGWFKRGEMVPEFEQVAFTLKPGAISEPVKTNFGYHVIMVEDRKMQKDSVVEVKARHILRKIQPTAETLDSLEEYVENLRKVMLEKGFIQALQGRGEIRADSTGLFKKGDMIRGIGYLSGVYAFAFPREEESEAVSERLENEFAFFLLSVKRRTAKGLLPLTDVKERIVWSLKDSICNEKARSYLATLRSSLPEGAALAALQDNDPRIVSGVSDTVSARQYVQNVGYDNSAVAMAFNLPEGRVSDVVASDGAFFIVRPLWKMRADDLASGSSEAERIKVALVDQAKRNIYSEWYVNYRKKFKIEENINRYFE